MDTFAKKHPVCHIQTDCAQFKTAHENVIALEMDGTFHCFYLKGCVLFLCPDYFNTILNSWLGSSIEHLS